MEPPSTSSTFPLFKQHFLHPDVWAAQPGRLPSEGGASNASASTGGGGVGAGAGGSIAGRLVLGTDSAQAAGPPQPSLKKTISALSTASNGGGRVAPPPALDLSGLPSRGALSRQESGAAPPGPPLLASAGGSANFSTTAASLRSSIASLGAAVAAGRGQMSLADEDDDNADAALADAPVTAALAALAALDDGNDPSDPSNSAYLLSESALKRRKFALFERDCSRVAEGLFVAGEAVARSRALLAEKKVTHVLNCVGQLYAPFFARLGVSYHTIHLRDAPGEDLLCVLHDALDFIDGARRAAAPKTALAEGGAEAEGGVLEAGGVRGGGSEGAAGAAAGPGAKPGAKGAAAVEESEGKNNGGGGDGDGGNGAAATTKTAAPKTAARPPNNPNTTTTTTTNQSATTTSCGQVLVHCSQGVSRSAALAVAYLMWSCDWPYQRAYAHVRQLRGVAAPNIGFTCQLLQWGGRRKAAQEALEARRGGVAAAAAAAAAGEGGGEGAPVSLQPVRVYRVAPHCAEAPLYLVAKAVAGLGSGGGGGGNGGGLAAASLPPVALSGNATPNPPALWRALDSRGAFVVIAPLQHPAAVAAAETPPTSAGCWVWRGASCPRALAAAASRAAAQLARYELAPAPAVAVAQGREPLALLQALGFVGAGLEQQQQDAAASAAALLGRRLSRQASLSSSPAAATPASPSGLSAAVGEVEAYTADYQLYALAAAARGEGEE